MPRWAPCVQKYTEHGSGPVARFCVLFYAYVFRVVEEQETSRFLCLCSKFELVRCFFFW